jgi:hypothetical protein
MILLFYLIQPLVFFGVRSFCHAYLSKDENVPIGEQGQQHMIGSLCNHRSDILFVAR